jgi:hypothetical protein
MGETKRPRNQGFDNARQPKGARIERESIKSGHGDAVGWAIFRRTNVRTGPANASCDAKAGVLGAILLTPVKVGAAGGHRHQNMVGMRGREGWTCKATRKRKTGRRRMGASDGWPGRGHGKQAWGLDCTHLRMTGSPFCCC